MMEGGEGKEAASEREGRDSGWKLEDQLASGDGGREWGGWAWFVS